MEPFRVIRLTQGKATIVDPEDYDRVAHLSWYALWDSGARAHYATHGYYDKATKSFKNFSLSRFIMNAPKGMVVDHINHDTLDNRRCNLRICTHKENSRNRKRNTASTSGVKGVYFDKGCNRWRARIFVDGKRLHLGTYVNLSDASHAYDCAAARYYGEFACPNQKPNQS